MKHHFVVWILTGFASGLLMLTGCSTPSPSTPTDASAASDMERSQIKHTGYDADQQSLVVTFTNGRVFLFTDVPEDTYKAFQQASSQAAFFNREINGHFPYHSIK